MDIPGPEEVRMEAWVVSRREAIRRSEMVERWLREEASCRSCVHSPSTFPRARVREGLERREGLVEAGR